MLATFEIAVFLTPLRPLESVDKRRQAKGAFGSHPRDQTPFKCLPWFIIYSD